MNKIICLQKFHATLVFCVVLSIGSMALANEEMDGPIKVEVVETEDGYQMLRNGTPYL